MRPLDILSAIGDTSLVALQRLAPAGGARVLAKLEWENPTGSMKDRMAASMIGRAEADGRLKPGDSVLEYTGGSTGTSLAFLCAARGYPLRIVTSDAFSQEKRDHMAALGAELIIVPSPDGTLTRQLFLDMIEKARTLSRESHTFWTNQLENPDNAAGYASLGEEIWQQTGGQIDAFVHSVGTAGSLMGIARALKARKPAVRVFAVEPEESPVLRAGAPGAHRIEGIGVGFRPALWDPGLVDEVLAVRSEAAQDMARRLAREEAMFAGTSSGANVVAALEVARRLGAGATVVTVMVDSGMKYLSTEVYRGAARM